MIAGDSVFRGLLNNLRSRFEAQAIPFVIGGSFATAARGYLRATNDLDVMVLLRDGDDLGRVHRALLAPPERFTWINEVTFRDEESRLLIEVFPVTDDAQRHVFQEARLTPLQGASGIHVLTTEGIILMLLRQATMEGRSNLQRLVDIERLSTLNRVDWKVVREWSRRMGFAEAYQQVRAEDKPPY